MSIHATLRKAELCAQNHDYQEAHRLLDQAGHADEAGEQAGLICFVRGNVMFQEDNIPEAIARYEEALRRDYISSRLLLNLGAARLMEGKPLLAEQLYRQAVELAPNDPLPHECLIQLRLDRGDYVGAEAIADKMAENLPALYGGYARKIAILSATQRVDAAWELLEKLALRFSSHPGYICDRAYAAARQGRLGEGLAYLDDGAEFFDKPQLVRLFRDTRVDLLLMGEQTDLAEGYLRDAFLEDGNRKAGLALVGAALSRQDFPFAIQLTQVMTAGEHRDWPYYLCLYLNAVAQKAGGAASPTAFEQALAAIERADVSAFALELGLLRVAILRELGRNEQALSALDAIEKWVKAQSLPQAQRTEALALLKPLGEEVKRQLESFT